MNVKNGIASSVEFAMMPEHALGQRLQQRRLELPCAMPISPNSEAVGGERERDRIAEQQEHHQPREHQRRHQFERHQARALLLEVGGGDQSLAGTRRA